jgi:L-threonylcarbamoyladenylate synthase
LELAAAALRAGQLVAFPTETVYGLGANALDAEAVRRIFAAKGRPSHNPIIVHIADVALAPEVVSHWPDQAQQLAQRFWPGPLTLVLPKRAEIPTEVTAGLPSVGIRVPSHPVALELLKRGGLPVAAPSANRSNEISPTTAIHVFESLQGRIDYVINGGPCTSGIESTVLDLTTSPPRILRPGPISLKDVQEAIGPVECATTVMTDQPLPSPGLMPRHYAPHHPLELTSDDGASRVRDLIAMGRRVGWLTWIHAPGVRGSRRIDMPDNAVDYATRLYAALHEADDWPIDVIVVAAPPDEPEWLAIRDRLRRAAQ